MPRSSPSRAQRGDDRHVALLRGINVGGKNRLAMKDLVALFEALGCAEVATYIQSGNVVFRASAALARSLPRAASAALGDRLGLDVPVVIRGRSELAAVWRDNPQLAAGADPGHLHVAFLADRPSAARIAALEPDRSPPDQLVVLGREVYLACPNGMARTRFTNDYLDRTLATTSTVRNWRTVGKLVELVAG